MAEIKGILIDLDNTLYDYERCHKVALIYLVEFLSSRSEIDKKTLHVCYQQVREEIHHELKVVASMHNRLLYLQRLAERLDHQLIPHVLEGYYLYWDVYIKHIVLFDGVKEFLDKNKDKKIAFVTDLTADVQHKKLLHLNLWPVTTALVTSEEAGCEKPDERIFRLALKKLYLKPAQVCMIGDDYQKDIVGATKLGIKSYWFNPGAQKVKPHPLVTEFKDFKKLLECL